MTDFISIFRAGFVHRWHTNLDLCHVPDRIDGHSARVARIILAINPAATLPLIKAALTHDDGEGKAGDMCALAKAKYPELAALLEKVEKEHRERLWGSDPDLTQTELAWLKFADRLDAYMWAAHHAQHTLSGGGWPEAWEWLREEGERLGAEVGLDAVCDMRRARHATS